MVNFENLTSDNFIARFCVQGTELFTLEHSRTPYLQSKKEPSSGHTLEYGYFEKKTSDDSIARFSLQGTGVFTLGEHSRYPYLQSKKELSSGHTLEYRYFEKTV